MRISSAFLPLAAAAILITGCGDKDPANKAVAQATESVEKLRPEATQFAPKELAVVDATLNRMKENLAKEKYSDVIKEVPQLNTQYATAVETTSSTKTLSAAAQNEWQELNTEVPKTVQELELRVETLSKGVLPKEITKETLAAAKEELNGMKATWAEATAAASAGDTFAATDKGRSVQSKGEKLKDQLGLSASVASL
jgi:hypothetical protein